MNPCPDSAATNSVLIEPRFRFSLRGMLWAVAAIGVLLTPITYFGAGGVLLSGGIVVVAYLIRDLWRNASAFSVLLLFVLLPYGAVVLMAVWPPVYSGPGPPGLRCRHNISGIASAMESYQEKNGRLPAAQVRGHDGRPWLSWRVLILPHVGEQKLFDAYLPTEPWNGPTNRGLLREWPWPFECKSECDQPRHTTNFLLVTGVGSAWDGERPPTVAELRKLPPDTIVLLEIKNSRIQWMEPRDLTIDEITKRVDDDGLKSMAPHSEGIHVLRADFGIETLPLSLDRESFRRRLTAADD